MHAEFKTQTRNKYSEIFTKYEEKYMASSLRHILASVF